ncbi:MAG: ABC transporter permease [Thermodesulfobacteriota bacterium]
MNLGARIDAVSGPTGRWLLNKVFRIVDHLAFFWVCLRTVVRYRSAGRRLIGRILVEQIYFTGVQSLELITMLALLSGALIILQGVDKLARLGNLEGLSVLLIAALIREIGPLVTAIIVVLRSGSAIALEIGYMKVLGEIEGLEMQGIPTLHLLCAPRLLGVATAVVCLIIIFDMISVVGGFFAAWALTDITAWSYFRDLASTIQRSDFLVVLVKGLCFGLMIPVVCMYNGFLAEGAITSVPPRVSRALVDCLLYSVFLNIIVSVSFSF